MKLKTDQLFIMLFVTLIGCSIAHANEDDDSQFYEIELIAFSHNSVVDNDEQWPPSETGKPPGTGKQLLPAPPASTTTTDIQQQEFTMLSREQRQLDPIASTLIRRGLANRILLHTGWRQKIRPANNAEPIIITGGQLLATPHWAAEGASTYIVDLINHNNSLQTPGYWESPTLFRSHRFELEGTASFYQTRYPRLEIDICLIIEPNTAQTLPFMPSQQNLMSTSARVCSREIRGIRYGDLSYFDTPYFGVLAQIRPLDQSAPRELN